ncbi:MAG: amidohydrolase [Gammaproteobacteria bacterium]|nr:amidohydrolase [Gammaproteobacteria bacterium]
MKRTLRLLAGLALLAVARGVVAAGPLDDAHIHYSANAHGEVGPERALALLDEAGIRRAMVSSTPDDGTLALYRLAPERIVPVLRPYRDRGDMAAWHRDPEVVAYVADRLGRREIYRGLGEFHIDAGDVGSAEMARLIELAREHGLFLHAHTDGDGIEALAAAAPGVPLLWAHAGLGEPVAVVDRVLARHPGLMADLSYRYDAILDGTSLDPAWREVLVRHADRFLMGSDTWAPSRWPALPATTARARTILDALPAEVAARLAHGNFDALLAR